MHSTKSAARQLGVTPARVRALIHAGHLHANRVGRDWLIPDETLAVLASRPRPATHRSFAARVAWATAREGAGEPSPWVSSSERSRLRLRLRDGSTTDVWRARLARRAAGLHRFKIHPDLLNDLLTDPRVHAPSNDDALPSGLRVVRGASLLWCAESDLLDLKHDRALLQTARPTVVLRILPPDVTLEPSAPAPPLIAGADLCDEGDPRSVRAGEFLLRLGLGSDAQCT